MNVNFDKYSVEKRHNQRFLGIFLMFAVIAVVIGLFMAFSVANISGYSFFSFLQPSSSGGGGSSIALGNGSGGGNGTNGTNPGNTLVTYQGVLDMLDRCFVAPSNTGNMNMTCRQVCGMNNIGTCVAGFIIDENLTHQDRPVPCGYPIWRSSQRLTCTCCSVPTSIPTK